MKPQTLGMILGAFAIVCFSLTLPATRLAVRDLDPAIVGLGRSAVAAVFAAIVLLVTRQKWPSREAVGFIYVIAAGTVFGFPLLTSWAMESLPASHGAIVVGLAPLLSSILGVIRMQEKPPLLHWIATFAGSAVVVAYAILSGAGQVLPADLALLGAALLVSVGYIEGARLSKELGAWQVTCWVLIFSAPIVLAILFFKGIQSGFRISENISIFSWVTFVYICLVSQFLVFFAWYRGLALGGVARVSQMQLFQPFLTIFFGVLLLDEKIDFQMIIAAFFVIACILLSRSRKIINFSEIFLKKLF